MNDAPKRRKSRQTLVEGLNNVPHLLQEARQAVDAVTPSAPEAQGEASPAKTRQSRVPASKRPAKAASPRKKPAPRAAAPKKPASPAAAAATEPPAESSWGLADYGISVKHALPGRVRLRLGRMLHNDTLAEKLPALLVTVPGVTHAEASAATGSLLLTFNARDLAGAKNRRDLAGVMHQFFPGLDTETLINRLLRA